MKLHDTNRAEATRRTGARRLSCVVALVAFSGACATTTTSTGPGERTVPGPDAPAMGAAADSARGDTAAAGAEAVDSLTIDAETAPDSASELEARLVELARAARGPEPELPPIKPFGVSWAPSPKEGHAFSVRVYERPTGRKPVAIEGEFAGKAVRFARLGPRGQWFGVGAVPIGRSDPATLTLRMEFADGATYEQSTRIAVEGTSYPSSNLSVDPRYSSPPPEVLERIRRERALIRRTLETMSPEWRMEGGFRPPRPLDVTSPFGQARMFNGELRSRHTGVDLRGQTGAPVRAAAAGRVALARELYFAGNAVFVDHGLGVYTGYFHLSRIDVEEGDEVDAGTLLGEVGATGRVTGAHLHWYLAVDGEAVDASSLLDMRLPD